MSRTEALNRLSPEELREVGVFIRDGLPRGSANNDDSRSSSSASTENEWLLSPPRPDSTEPDHWTRRNRRKGWRIIHPRTETDVIRGERLHLRRPTMAEGSEPAVDRETDPAANPFRERLQNQSKVD